MSLKFRTELGGRLNVKLGDAAWLNPTTALPKLVDQMTGHNAGEALSTNKNSGSSDGANAEEWYSKNYDLSVMQMETFQAYAEAQMKLAETNARIASEQWDRYLEVYAPVEDKWVRTAQVGVPTDYFVAAAGNDVQQAYKRKRDDLDNSLMKFGIDPSSPKFEQMDKDLAIAEAAAEAGAKNKARMSANDINYSRMSDVVKTGRGIPTEAASMNASAMQGISDAAQTTNMGIDNVTQATSQMAGYYAQKEQAKMQADSANDQALWGALGSIAGTGGGVAIASMMCWVAREVYGQDNPKWEQFKAWLLEDAPAWFRSLYATHGEKFAAWIHDKPRIKAAIRWWMDRRIAAKGN